MMFFACLALTLLCGLAASILERHYIFIAENKFIFSALVLAGAGLIIFPVLAMFFAFQFLGATL